MISRFAAIAAFALAYLVQPLALDACAVSSEAARAARQASVAAPCHHTTSCASQISQPTSPSSSASVYSIAPEIVSIDAPLLTISTLAPVSRISIGSFSPPGHTPLRL